MLAIFPAILAVVIAYGMVADPARVQSQVREGGVQRLVKGLNVVALGLWLLGSVGFSYYVDNLGTYNQTYGALTAVIILLLWLLLSAFVVLLGAEFDAETGRQTALAESPQRR